jgi:hypothetical protein
LQPFGGESLNRDSHKLAAGANARFVEEFLDGGLNQGFRGPKLRCDFLVAQAIEYAAKYNPLAVG